MSWLTFQRKFKIEHFWIWTHIWMCQIVLLSLTYKGKKTQLQINNIQMKVKQELYHLFNTDFAFWRTILRIFPLGYNGKKESILPDYSIFQSLCQTRLMDMWKAGRQFIKVGKLLLPTYSNGRTTQLRIKHPSSYTDDSTYPNCQTDKVWSP